MPAATTATRAFPGLPFGFSKLGMISGLTEQPFRLLSDRKGSSNHVEKKTAAREVGGLSVEFISGDLKSDEREQ